MKKSQEIDFILSSNDQNVKRFFVVNGLPLNDFPFFHVLTHIHLHIRELRGEKEGNKKGQSCLIISIKNNIKWKSISHAQVRLCFGKRPLARWKTREGEDFNYSSSKGGEVEFSRKPHKAEKNEIITCN